VVGGSRNHWGFRTSVFERPLEQRRTSGGNRILAGTRTPRNQVEPFPCRRGFVQNRRSCPSRTPIIRQQPVLKADVFRTAVSQKGAFWGQSYPNKYLFLNGIRPALKKIRRDSLPACQVLPRKHSRVDSLGNDCPKNDRFMDAHGTHSRVREGTREGPLSLLLAERPTEPEPTHCRRW